MNKGIHVIGAGPAGLTASIILNREGFMVTVHEAEKQVGGDPRWHPSVHATPINFDILEEYTGIDYRPAFKDCIANLLYYDRSEKKTFWDFCGSKFPNMYTVVRGPVEGSLDDYLYKVAIKEGVEVKLKDKWTTSDFNQAPENTIIATGFGQSAYQDLGMKFTPFYGYWTRENCLYNQVHGTIYTGDFTNEYGFTTSMNGIWYCLLFARGDVTERSLKKYEAILKDKEGITVGKWGRFTGTTARFPKFIDGKFIFAGTAAGFIEPAQGYGILSAFLGGKIAAMAITDPEKATSEYNKYLKAVVKHIQLKFKPGYRPSTHFRENQLWFDIPTVMAGKVDYDDN